MAVLLFPLLQALAAVAVAAFFNQLPCIFRLVRTQLLLALVEQREQWDHFLALVRLLLFLVAAWVAV